MVYTVNGLYGGGTAQGISVETVQKRRRALSWLRMLCAASIVVSSCNIPVGIVILTNRGEMEFPLTSGAPIWSGALVLVCSIHGLKVSWMEVEYEHVPSPRDSLHLKAYHNINRVSVLTSLACIALSAVYVLYCGRDSYNPESCPTSEREEMISNILAMLISVLMMICSIIGIILLRLNGKALGLKKLLEMTSEENRNARQEQSEDISENISPRQSLGPTAPPLYTDNSPDPYAPPQYDRYLERDSPEGNRRQAQTEETPNRELFENMSHPQRLVSSPYDSTFPDPSAPPLYERNSFDPTESEHRNTEFYYTSHSQRFGLPPYDNNDSDLTESGFRTAEIEINSHPRVPEPPLHDSSLPDSHSTYPNELNPFYDTESDNEITGFQSNLNPQRLGLPSYEDVSDPTEIGARTTELQNNSHRQHLSISINSHTIDLTEPPPSYDEYMRNLQETCLL